MILSQLNDDEMRDILSESVTTIEKALHFTRSLADGFVYFPADQDARAQLIDASLTIQATLADQLDAMRLAFENWDRGNSLQREIRTNR